MLKQAAILTLAFSALVSIAFAAGPLVPDQTSSSFRNAATFGSAGEVSSASLKIQFIAYDASVYTSGISLSTCLGAWCPALSSIPSSQIYSMRFSGTVTYSNGTVIPNSDIEVGVKDAVTSQFFFKNTRTDGTGYFEAKIDNVPASVLSNGYSVSIRLISAVEAAYQKICSYDSGTNKWLC